MKRQRTVSLELATRRASNVNHEDDSRPLVSSSKKIKGAAAKNHHAREARDEKERIRQEAANKRQGRAARRQQGELYTP
jgi:hypothetical protein